MPRYSLLRPFRRALILALTVLPLAGCGQTGRLFLRQPLTTFPPLSPPPTLRFHDLRLPACLYQAEMARITALPPGAIVQAPEAVTSPPLTAAVTDADGFQQEAPLPCAIMSPTLLKSGELPKPTPAPGAATGAAP